MSTTLLYAFFGTIFMFLASMVMFSIMSFATNGSIDENSIILVGLAGSLIGLIGGSIAGYGES